jgi:predicted RNA binding protein YcfA (HicA-like mRNA interferase family)
MNLQELMNARKPVYPRVQAGGPGSGRRPGGGGGGSHSIWEHLAAPGKALGVLSPGKPANPVAHKSLEKAGFQHMGNKGDVSVYSHPEHNAHALVGSGSQRGGTLERLMRAITP